MLNQNDITGMTGIKENLFPLTYWLVILVISLIGLEQLITEPTYIH